MIDQNTLRKKKHGKKGNILNSLVALSLFKTSSLDSEKNIYIYYCVSVNKLLVQCL